MYLGRVDPDSELAAVLFDYRAGVFIGALATVATVNAAE